MDVNTYSNGNAKGIIEQANIGTRLIAVMANGKRGIRSFSGSSLKATCDGSFASVESTLIEEVDRMEVCFTIEWRESREVSM